MSARTGPVGRAWASYRERVLPVDAPPVQVRECQLAFYAGAVSLHEALLGGVSPGDGVTDADMELMEAIELELRAFVESVR